MPGLPDPPRLDFGRDDSSQRCAECGHWNDASDLRCERCGLRLNSQRGADARRGLEASESLPEPKLPPVSRAPEKEQPVWKSELQNRLAGYRERQAASAQQSLFGERDEEGSAAPLPLPRASSSALPSPRERTETSERGERLPPIRRLDEEPELEDRHSEAADRPSSSRETRRRLDWSQAEPPPAQRPTVLTEGPTPAPIPQRVVAGLMDFGVVLGAMGLFLGLSYVMNPAPLASVERPSIIIAAFAAIQLFYWILFLRYPARTPGMVWAGLKIVNLDGQEPTAAQRRTRVIGTILSAASLCVGFLWAAADEQKLTWHDRISKTLVVVDRS